MVGPPSAFQMSYMTYWAENDFPRYRQNAVIFWCHDFEQLGKSDLPSYLGRQLFRYRPYVTVTVSLPKRRFVLWTICARKWNTKKAPREDETSRGAFYRNTFIMVLECKSLFIIFSTTAPQRPTPSSACSSKVFVRNSSKAVGIFRASRMIALPPTALEALRMCAVHFV